MIYVMCCLLPNIFIYIEFLTTKKTNYDRTIEANSRSHAKMVAIFV